MKRLVLFDIDGTLITGGGVWRDAFEDSVADLLPGAKIPRIAFGGRTDPWICRELLRATGVPEGEFDSWSERILRGYLERARALLETRRQEVRILPGVEDVLRSLSDCPEVCLGLLTGNIREGARLKLQCVGLSRYFPFGVYGDDHWDRYQLPAIAVDRARGELGATYGGKQVVIIGDTIHDVNCGKSIGARSIAVGTGHRVTAEELLAENPDFYFEIGRAHV